MRTSRKLHYTLTLFVTITILTLLNSFAIAADPGAGFPAASAINDQKPGAMLVYNVYTSSITNLAGQNTRINLTNTSATDEVYVHLFFVDGATCQVADSYICLTPNQTATMMASDLDPGITGYLLAVAVDGRLGCPINANVLIGDVYVKFPSGHTGNLPAQAIAAQFTGPTGCDETTVTAALNFDGTGNGYSYNQLPRALAIDNIADRTSGNSVLMVLNRIGGNMAIGASTIGSVFGILYDDAESAFSFSFSTAACQFRSTLSNTFPRTAPRFETVIPAGRSGWLKLWADSPAVGLLGAVFNANASAAQANNAFNGAHNMHALTLNNSSGVSTPGITIPIFPPSC